MEMPCAFDDDGTMVKEGEILPEKQVEKVIPQIGPENLLQLAEQVKNEVNLADSTKKLLQTVQASIGSPMKKISEFAMGEILPVKSPSVFLTKTQQKKYQRVTTAELTEDIKKDYIKSYDDTGVLKYCGEFNHFNWKKDGSGIEYFECSTKIEYKGSFKEDLRHGFGFSYHSNGSLKYRGRFVAGLPHGMGTLYDTENLLSYKGFFESGVFSSNGQKYEPKTGKP
jgi:hypothetical protein